MFNMIRQFQLTWERQRYGTAHRPHCLLLPPCLPLPPYPHLCFLFAINSALILVSQPVFDPRQLETRDFLGACHYGLGSQNYESFPQIGLVSPASFR